MGVWLSTKVGRADYVDLRNKDRLRPWVKEIAEDLLVNDKIVPCAEDFRTYFELVRSNEDPLFQ